MRVHGRSALARAVLFLPAMPLSASLLAFALAPLQPTPLASVVGDTTVDLGHDQHLRIQKDGVIWLDDDIMALSVGLDPEANVYAHRLTRDRVTVAVGLRIPHLGGPDHLVVAEIDLLRDALVWSAVIDPPTLTHQQGSTWQVIFGDDRMLVQREHLLVAVDMSTGTQAWSFANLDPTFDEDYFGSLGIAQGEIDITRTRVNGREVVVEGKRRADGKKIRVELDIDTGRRVFVDTKHERSEPQPLFAFSERMPEPVDDGPLPSPPDKPEQYDGLVVGYTTLVWNTATARGVILNPTANAAGEIVELARKITITNPDGTVRPVEFVAAFDTGTLATEMSVGKVDKRDKKRVEASITFDYEDGLAQSGESIDVDTVATALDIPAIRGRVDLPRVPEGVRVQQREWGSIEVVFGPLAFHDDTQRWSEQHVRRP